MVTMPVKVEAYQCEYCGKLCKRQHSAKAHEASCRCNPAARHCITCIHGILATTRFKPDWSDPFGPGNEECGPYCGYHDKPISEKPYFIDCDNGGGFCTGLGYHPEFPQPYTCLHYESKGKAGWTPEEQYEGG